MKSAHNKKRRETQNQVENQKARMNQRHGRREDSGRSVRTQNHYHPIIFGAEAGAGVSPVVKVFGVRGVGVVSEHQGWDELVNTDGQYDTIGG